MEFHSFNTFMNLCGTESLMYLIPKKNKVKNNEIHKNANIRNIYMGML